MKIKNLNYFRPDLLDDLMKSHDVVVSLLPWTIHADIAKRCIANKVNMVTASYQSDALKVIQINPKGVRVFIFFSGWGDFLPFSGNKIALKANKGKVMH